jgi:hypothetical protein
MVNLRRIKQANSSDLLNANRDDRIYVRDENFSANEPSSYIPYDFISAKLISNNYQIELEVEDPYAMSPDEEGIQVWKATHFKANGSVILPQTTQDGKETNYIIYVKKPIRSSIRRHRSSGGKRTRRR